MWHIWLRTKKGQYGIVRLPDSKRLFSPRQEVNSLAFSQSGSFLCKPWYILFRYWFFLLECFLLNLSMLVYKIPFMFFILLILLRNLALFASCGVVNALGTLHLDWQHSPHQCWEVYVHVLLGALDSRSQRLRCEIQNGLHISIYLLLSLYFKKKNVYKSIMKMVWTCITSLNT